MRISGLIFSAGIFFFIPVAFVYGYLTDFKELVGFPAIVLVGLMSLMIGAFVFLQDKKMGKHPQDIESAEISDESYEYGFYSPWSWWPLSLAAGIGICFLAVAVGWWIMPFGGVLCLVSLIGLVYEYDRGNHAH